MGSPCAPRGVVALAMAAALFAGAGPAGAVSTSYFAEDVAPLGTTTPPSTFTNSSLMEAQFQATLLDPETESFESFPIADHGPLAIFASGPVTGTLSDTVDDGGSIRGALDDAVNRGFPTAASQFWKNETTSDASDDLFRVTFSQQVRAFGFYATAYSTESTPTMDATSLVLTLERAGGVFEAIAINHTHLDRPGSVFYFGVTSDDPFLAAYLRNASTTDPGDRIGFDDFTVAIVPEPSTVLLLLAGLLGLALVGRRRSA